MSGCARRNGTTGDVLRAREVECEKVIPFPVHIEFTSTTTRSSNSRGSGKDLGGQAFEKK